MTEAFPRLALPALKATMGTWVYYITSLTLSDVASMVRKTTEVHQSERLSAWIQRHLQGKHVSKIVEYLTSQDERFFNSLVLGVYKGDPKWLSVTVSRARAQGEFQLSRKDLLRLDDRYGILVFSGEERLFAIDGQHRVAAIKQALPKAASLHNEEVPAILVAHRDSTTGRARTRRLFTTLNKTAKRVSQAELIALDEDNGYAIATRWLVDNDPFFALGRVIAFRSTAPLPENEPVAFTTIIALYQILKDLAPLVPGLSHREFSRSADPDQVGALVALGTRFFRALCVSVPACDDVLHRRRAQSRRYRQGRTQHLLFRPIGQRAYARALVHLVQHEGENVDSGVRRLARVDLALTGPLWREILWDPANHIMLTRTAHLLLAEAVLLEQVRARHTPRSLLRRLAKHRADS